VIRAAARLAWRALWRFFAHNGPDRAAAVAYYMLLSLLPLLVFLISLGRYVLGSWDAAYQRAIFLLQGVLAHTDQSTLDALRQFAEQASRFNAPSLLILAWTSKRVFSSLLSALEVAFDHPGRGIAQGNLVALAMVMATGLALLLSMLLTAVLATIDGFFRRLAGPGMATLVGSLAAFFLAFVLPVLITAAFFFIVYRVGARPEVTTLHAALGALFATVLWEVAKTSFAYYLRNLAHYAGLYGTLEGLIVLAIWLELSVSIILYGGELVALTAPPPASALTTAPAGE
jgi:membrane protein